MASFRFEGGKPYVGLVSWKEVGDPPVLRGGANATLAIVNACAGVAAGSSDRNFATEYKGILESHSA